MEEDHTSRSDNKKSLKQRNPSITDEEQGSDSSPQKAGKWRAEDKEPVNKCNRPWYS